MSSEKSDLLLAVSSKSLQDILKTPDDVRAAIETLANQNIGLAMRLGSPSLLTPASVEECAALYPQVFFMVESEQDLSQMNEWDLTQLRIEIETARWVADKYQGSLTVPEKPLLRVRFYRNDRGDVAYDQLLEQFARNAKRYDPICHENGVVLAVENMPWLCHKQLDDLKRVLIGTRNIEFLVDFKNCTSNEGNTRMTPEEMLEHFNDCYGRIAAFHVDPSNKELRQYTRQVMELVKKTGPGHPVIIEPGEISVQNAINAAGYLCGYNNRT